jgi:hypothetical protein|tara:strand:+ start:412 stop:660 length:249 start_codon:yes stop_codon:yes gene_type:complete
MSAATGIMALIKRLAAKHMGKSIARKKRDGGGGSKAKNRKEGKELNEDLISKYGKGVRSVHQGKKQAAESFRKTARENKRKN